MPTWWLDWNPLLMKLRVFLSPRQVGILTYSYPLSITGFVSLGEARHSWHKKTGSQHPSLHLLFTVLARDFFVESNFWKSANAPSFEKPSFISCEPIALLSFLTIALSPCRSSSRRTPMLVHLDTSLFRPHRSGCSLNRSLWQIGLCDREEHLHFKGGDVGRGI